MVVDERVEVFAEGEGRVEGARRVEVEVRERGDCVGVGGRGDQRGARERLAVQRHVLHVVRFLDRREVLPSHLHAGRCEPA